MRIPGERLITQVPRTFDVDIFIVRVRVDFTDIVTG